MSSIMGIEISEDEEQMACDMGLAEYIEEETGESVEDMGLQEEVEEAEI